jgi:pimeloyl-ACP methyl ester carboxylesterase
MPFSRINGIDLYYEVHGEGYPMLLLPGLGSDANTWAPFLAGAPNYRAVIPENRGCARSSKPESGYSIEIMAHDAAILMDHLGIERAHVLGKSMGAMVAQFLTARHPGKVRSLVLSSTVMKHDTYGEELLELGRMVAQKVGLYATYRQAFLLSYSREYCMSNRSRLEEAESLLKKIGSEEMLRGYLGQSIACQNYDGRTLVSQIKAPTLVIVGKQDIITPPEASQELAAAIPGAELVIFPRGGHGFWREFPQDVNPVVLDFLSRH